MQTTSVVKHVVSRLLQASVLLPALLALALQACNDGPSTVGSDYLNQNIVFKTLTFKAGDLQFSSGVATATNASVEGGTSMLVGSAPDGTVAHTLLGITSLNTLVSGPTAKTIKTATLRLRASGYRYGDTNSRRATFDVIVVNQSFPSTIQWSDTLIAKINVAQVLGSFTASYLDTTIVSVDLNPSLTTRFFNGYYRNDTTFSTVNGLPDTIVKRVILKSLALRARSDGSMIGSFVSPIYQNISDSLKPAIRLALSDTTIDIRPDISSWIANTSAPRGTGVVTAMAGVPLRTSLRFPIDSIPSTATIHQATLTLYVDTVNSRFGTSGPARTLIAYIADDSSLVSPTSFLTSKGLGFFLASRTTIDSAHIGDVFRFSSLAPAITSWQRNSRGVGGTRNNGMILALNRTVSATVVEPLTVDRIRFFGPNAADSTKRPTLTVVYSIQKDK